MPEYTGFDLTKLDYFKKYQGYEGQYIMVDDIRYTFNDNDILKVSDNLEDLLAYTEINNLDYTLGYVTNSGYPSFYIQL